MKYPVKRFRSLRVALKELESFIRHPEHLQTGKPLKRFGGMLPRELLANWLLCVAVNSNLQAERLTFCSDPVGGDGVIYDTATEETYLTEHTVIPELIGGDAVDIAPLILKAIEQKRHKGGEAYASGKTLVVFQTAKGQNWFPNKVAKQLPDPLYFDAVWVVGLQGVENGGYIYQVTRLDLRRGNAPAWRVRIGKDFDGWEVEPIQ
jgi:hypothetical protein